MHEFENLTRLPGGLFPGTDKNGKDYLTVVVKGTYAWARAGMDPELAEEQLPLQLADVHHGEPGESSVKYESDTSPAKPGTDIVVVGFAYAPKGKAKEVDVTVSVGPCAQTVRVFGDRKWNRGVAGWKPSGPDSFDRMPLVFERAYGGVDDSDDDAANHASYRLNPVGMGFAAGRKGLEDRPVPNLENPKDLLKGWKDRPEPAGFGFLGRGWSPRVERAGTYDDAWSNDRAPLLPMDFDDAYYNGAHPRMIADPKLRGGEAVRLENASASGSLRFDLPRQDLEAGWCIRDVWTWVPAELDTVVIEPEDSRVQMTWRATVPCGREMSAVDKVIVREVKA